MIVGIPAESYPDEQRVAVVPSSVPELTKSGLEVIVEKGAGEKAGFPDNEYEKKGANIVSERRQLFLKSDIILRIHVIGENTYHNELELFQPGQVVIGLLNPLTRPELSRELAQRNITAFALELLPRITRAQPMDVLSSMATIAGYKAVLIAANALKKMFPMMITAAGTITPAKVFVIGAGVAGLQAIATSKRLGAVVQAYDIRPSVKEQVQSLGAKFVELGLETKEAEASSGYARDMGEDFYRRQREMINNIVAESDVVITTASIPGRRAPVLITKDMIYNMKPGSVIVDMAAETGGNCEVTKPGEKIELNGVTILGPINLASTVPFHASSMYSRNITAFVKNLLRNGKLNINLEDPIIHDTLVTQGGEVVNPVVRTLLGLPTKSPEGKDTQ
ncbi:MAG: NAD(P) transhydrogenase subunit alpha [Deltaproteobacteria bacterium]|nr:MAG: NAD(P) transhydrogenase subunit alpha [Deltaproteobacteria bacterium]